MARLIFSESSFKHRTHSLHYVVGLCGINIKAWKDELPFNPYTDRGNIWSSAYILHKYLTLSNYNYHRAITKYKGNCSLGRKQATLVLCNNERNNNESKTKYQR